jgi:hypothetical protein
MPIVLRTVATTMLTVGLAPCDLISLTLFGVGTAAGASHTLRGIAYKAFTAP